MKGIKLLILLTAASILCLNSCKSSRQVPAKPMDTGIETPGDVSVTPARAIALSYADWTDLKIPVKIELQQPRRFSVSGNMTMVRGSAVSISLRMFGMEVGNIYVDTDSVLAVVKPMGVYFSESTARFTAGGGFGLDDIQALLLGRAFTPGGGQLTLSSAHTLAAQRLDDGEWMLVPDSQPAGGGYFFTASAGKEPCVTGLAVEPAGHSPILCNYSEIASTSAGPVAGKIRLRADIKGHSIDCTLTSNPAKAEWNQSRQIARPAIPKNARRITTALLMNMLKNL